MMHRTGMRGLLAGLMLLAFALPALAQRVEPGNVLHITVVGHPEFTRSVTVRPDGTTEYPVLGNIPVDGLTTPEVRQLITQVLKQSIDRPVVFVNLGEFAVIDVQVAGAVGSPGVLQIRSPADVYSVLMSAGGLEENADLSRIAIVRARTDGRLVEEIDLNEYLAQDPATAEQVMVHTGDKVVVPVLNRDSFVRVVGAVNSPGPYVPRSNETVLDLIYRAGGPERDADLTDVRYIRVQPDGSRTQEIFNLKEKLESGETFPVVSPGEMVILSYVEEWETFGFWARFVRDLSLLASAIVLLTRI